MRQSSALVDVSLLLEPALYEIALTEGAAAVAGNASKSGWATAFHGRLQPRRAGCRGCRVASCKNTLRRRRFLPRELYVNVLNRARGA